MSLLNEFMVNMLNISDARLKEAFLKVDPGLFGGKYLDRPEPIGHSQTISAPSMVLKMLEVLDVSPNQRVLEIGTGSGYTTALLSELVGPNGLVVTVELIEELLVAAKKRIHKNNVFFVNGDGKEGYPEKAPYDRILVTASASNKGALSKLISQLSTEGILVSPIGGEVQFLYKYEKNIWTKLLPVSFVPLL